MGNVAELSDRVSLVLPMSLLVELKRMDRERRTGQIIINFNRGEAQSFEVKEHYRL